MPRSRRTISPFAARLMRSSSFRRSLTKPGKVRESGQFFGLRERVVDTVTDIAAAPQSDRPGKGRCDGRSALPSPSPPARPEGRTEGWYKVAQNRTKAVRVLHVTFRTARSSLPDRRHRRVICLTRVGVLQSERFGANG